MRVSFHWQTHSGQERSSLGVFPARPVEVSHEPVVLARLELGQQLLDGLAHFGEFLNERLAVHYRVISR
jgi:hypothetical protein